MAYVTLPAAQPSGDLTMWHFVSADFEDYAYPSEYDETLAVYQAASTPFTVQLCPADND
jgi:hypothetical protein